MQSSERFAIRRDQLQLLCRKALCNGGDYCDLFFEDSTIWTLSLRDSEVSSGGYHRDYGCGIRVLDGERTGYAYSEATDMPSLLKAAAAASAISNGKGSGMGYELTKSDAGKNDFYPMDKNLKESDMAEFVPFLRMLDEKIRSRDRRVDKVVASLSYSLSEILMFNSLDELTSDTRPLCSLNVSAVFRQGDNFQTKSASKSLRMGLEFYNGELVEELARKVTSGVDAMFEAKRPKGGQMSVVMAAGASGILLHEAMGHAFEADFNRKGQSIFADKMGCRVCRKGINIVDDATLPGYRGSLNYDDEGVPGQKTYMVTDGVLTSFLHDRISARYYGVPSTGNGRRESFRYNPIPRMRSTYMENGSDGSVEDLISLAHNGIYVEEFANGEVKIGEGDFTFYVKSGFLIENGRLTMPIKDINIIGNGPQALAGIEAVAGDLKVDTGRWTCGKEQSAPVSCGIPSVLINNLTVGGGL